MVRGQVVSYFDFDGDSIIAVPFPLKIHDSKKNRAADRPTGRRTEPHIGMRGRL